MSLDVNIPSLHFCQLRFGEAAIFRRRNLSARSTKVGVLDVRPDFGLNCRRQEVALNCGDASRRLCGYEIDPNNATAWRRFREGHLPELTAESS